jgi:hypothetical protein
MTYFWLHCARKRIRLDTDNELTWDLVMTKNNPRFDLFALLEWTAAIAFLCALLAGAGRSSVWTWNFKSLPADDSALRAWLESQNRNDVIVSRDGNSVTLTSQTGVFVGLRNAFAVPKGFLIFDSLLPVEVSMAKKLDIARELLFVRHENIQMQFEVSHVKKIPETIPGRYHQQST